MKKLVILVILIVALPVIAQDSMSKDSGADKAASAPKEMRWQGTLLRTNKDASTIVVRGGMKTNDNFERTIAYDDSTKWTKQGKPADASEFKDGSFVIVTGHSDDKKMLHATRVDLRMPR